MERTNYRSHSPFDQNRTSSVYSYDSSQRPTDSGYAETSTLDRASPMSSSADGLTSRSRTPSTHSRAASYTPSYMNAKVPARKPIALHQIATASSGERSSSPLRAAPPPPPVVQKGILLLAIATQPHTSTIPYLEMMLKRGAYKEILLLGSPPHEPELKQLKMSIFALLGRLGKEISIRMELQPTWHAENLAKTLPHSDAIHGALCCPSYSGPRGEEGILALDDNDLETGWRNSIGFTHSLARFALPLFRANDQQTPTPTQTRTSGLFLMTSPTDSSPISALYRSSCDTLVKLLAESSAARGVAVDYADNVLVPDVELAGPEGKEDENNNSNNNGGKSSAPRVRSVKRMPVEEDDGYEMPDSPTKLYAMWSQHEELAGA